MKKLMMFAAAMTIVGGAYAQCEPGDEEVGGCALVYNVSASLKTTVAKAVGAKECDVAVCYRDVGSMKIKGYLYTCECDCEEGAFQNAVLTAWDSKSKYVVAYEDLIEWSILHRIGKKAEKIEALGNLDVGDTEGDVGDTEGFVLAGFGKYDTKNDRVSSIDGSMIGVIEGPWCVDEINCEPVAPAWPIDLCYDIEIDVIDTIAYGTFSIKYNSGASKKYAKDDMYIYTLFPSFMD